MKKRSVIVLSTLAAGALALAGALPASAAVTYKATAEPTIGSLPAIDTSTGLIYSITLTEQTPDDQIYTEYLVATDAKTFKTKATYQIAHWDESEGPDGTNILDLRVNSKTHTVWLAVVGGEGDNGSIWEINGSTMKLIRTVSASNDYGYAPGKIAVNPTTNTVYVAWSWDDWVDGSASDTPFLEAINGSTGATSTAALPNGPSDDGGIYPYGYPGNVAFDSYNNGVYVAQGGHEYAYSSTTLKVASSLAFPSTETTSDPLLTADGSTHTIYAVGASNLYKIAGSTNTISATATIGNAAGALPVFDSTIKTLYVGTGVYSETTLAKSGTIPQPASSVNGTSHAIYSTGYVTTRSGS